MRDHQQITEDLVLYALRELPEQQALEFVTSIDRCDAISTIALNAGESWAISIPIWRCLPYRA